MNMTLMEKSRCMLSGVGLGKELWAEVMVSACYLVNISPSSMLDDKTPQEVWTGKKSSLTHLKVFGCDAYVHVPKENKSKLDKKDEKCIFIGYKDGLKGYRIWNQVLESNGCAHLTIDNIAILSPNHRPNPPPSTLTLIENDSRSKP
jgi:hypothetical protein